MKIIIVEPERIPRIAEIDGGLKSMQDIVGGLIEAVYPFEDSSLALVCNDEGKLLNLPPNRALYDTAGDLCDIVSGTFFLCAAPPDTESFASLTDEQVSWCMSRFAKPELFFRSGSEVAVIALDV